MWKLLVLVVLTWSVAVHGYDIISERLNIQSLNGQLRQNKTITLRCSRSDFGVPINLTVVNSITNASQSVQINVSATDITYQTNIWGYVPRAGRLETVECCLARDSSRYVPDQPAPEPDFDDFQGTDNQTWGGGPSIQAVHEAHHWSLQEKSHALSPFARRPKFLGAVLGGLLLVNEFFCFMNCPAKVDKWDTRSFDEFKNASTARVAALEEANRAAQIWQNNITGVVTSLTLAYEDTVGLFNATQESVQLLDDRLNITTTMFNLTTQAINDEIGYVRSSLAGTNVAVNNLTTYVATLVGAQNNTLQLAMNFTEQALRNVESTLNDMQNALVDRITTLDMRMRSMTELVFRLSGQVREAVLQFEVKRCLTRKIQARLLEIENEGTYVPFLADDGQQPAASLGPYRAILVDSVVLRYGYFSSGTYYLRRKVLTLECDTGFVLNRASDAMGWRDILDNLGPLTCDPLTFGSCSCWVTLNSKRCATNQTIIQSNVMNSSLAFDLNATWCTSAITTELTETITSPTGILDHFRGQCFNEPFLANSTATLAGTLVPLSYSVPHRSTICSMTLNLVFSSSQTNFVALLFDHWSRAYSLALQRKDVYSRIVDGRLPMNLTIKEDPFAYKNGVDLRCWRSNFMTYTPDWLPVYVFTNPVMSTSVSMRIGSQNITTKTSDVLVSQPFNFVLQNQIRVIGNPYSTTAVYDVADEDISLSQTAAGNLGTPTYPAVPYSNMTNNLSEWRRWWGVPFEHDKGVETASLYIRNVSGAFCTTQTVVSGGSFCDLKDYYFVYQKNSTMVLNAYSEKVDVTLVIPEGTVIANQFSDCPTAEITPISGTTTMVKLSNAQAVPVVVAIVESGACSRSIPSVTIGAGLAYEHLVPVCSSGNGQVALTVSKYVGGDLEACSSITGLNVTVNRPALLSVRGVPDLRYVNEITVVDVDKTALAVAQTQDRLFSLMGQFMITVLEGMQSISVVVPNKTFTDFSALLSSLNQTARESYDRMSNDSTRASLNVSSLTAPFYDRLANLSAQQAAIQSNYAATLANLSSRIVNVTSVVALLNESLVNYQQAQDRLLAAEQNFTNALVNFAANVSASLTQLTTANSMGFNLFSALGDVITDVVEGTIDLASDGGQMLFKLAKGMVELAEKGAKGFFGIMSKGLAGIFSGIATALTYLIVLGGGGYMAYRCIQRSNKKKAAKKAAEDSKKQDKPAAAATPAPAKAAATTPAVAATKASTDSSTEQRRLLQDDEDDDDDEEDDFISHPRHLWQVAVQRR